MATPIVHVPELNEHRKHETEGEKDAYFDNWLEIQNRKLLEFVRQAKEVYRRSRLLNKKLEEVEAVTGNYKNRLGTLRGLAAEIHFLAENAEIPRFDLKSLGNDFRMSIQAEVTVADAEATSALLRVRAKNEGKTHEYFSSEASSPVLIEDQKGISILLGRNLNKIKDEAKRQTYQLQLENPYSWLYKDISNTLFVLQECATIIPRWLFDKYPHTVKTYKPVPVYEQSRVEMIANKIREQKAIEAYEKEKKRLKEKRLQPLDEEEQKELRRIMGDLQEEEIDENWFIPEPEDDEDEKLKADLEKKMAELEVKEKEKKEKKDKKSKKIKKAPASESLPSPTKEKKGDESD